MNNNKRERLMLAAIFLFWFSVYTYPSFLSSYAEHTLKAGSVMVGLIVGSYGFTQMVIRIPLGIVSDIVKKRKLFVQLGFVASMIASIGLSVVSMFDATPAPALSAAVLVLRGMAGVAASTWVAFSVLYSAAYTPEETGAAMSRKTRSVPFSLKRISAVSLLTGIAFGTMLSSSGFPPSRT